MTVKTAATLLLLGTTLLASPPEPALEQVSNRELVGPLSVDLRQPPAHLGGVESFGRLYRDPRFPSVLLRRSGAVYAAFRLNRPLSDGGRHQPVPSDVVYFVGRPDEGMIAQHWPDALIGRAAPAVVTPAPASQAAPAVRRIEIPAQDVTVPTPMMAHEPSRARRLASLAARYAPTE